MTRRAWLLAFGLALAACAPATPPPTTPTPTATLRPYRSPTPRPSPTAGSVLGQATATPLPTPTPFVHVIQEGDTLLGLAFRYGVELGDLLAANPDINPRFLRVGDQLVIPIEGDPAAAAGLPTATPVPFVVGEPVCYRTPSDALWCLVVASNPSDQALEGVAVEVALLDEHEAALAVQAAYAPLRRLPPERSLPLVAYFAPPAPAFARVLARPLTALYAADTEEPRVSLDWAADLEPGALMVEVDGQVEVEGEGEGFLVRVVASGLDEAGRPAGFAEAELEVLPGEPAAFQMTLFSLGPPLASVDVLAEAARLP